MIPISKCTQTVTFYVPLKSTWIFKQIKNKNLFCSCKHIEISTRLFFRLDLGMVMGGDGFEIHAHARQPRQVGSEYMPTVKNTCILFLHQARSILKDSKKNFISPNNFQILLFY